MSFLVALWIDLRGEGVGKAASTVSGWKVELGFDISSIKLIVV